MPEEPTTLEPVELAQRFIDAGNAMDIDAVMNLCASDIAWEGRIDTIEGRAALHRLVRRQTQYLDIDEVRAAAERLAEERV